MLRWVLIFIYFINIVVYGFSAIKRISSPSYYFWGADGTTLVTFILLLLIAFGALLLFKKPFFEDHWSFRVFSILVASLAVSPFLLDLISKF